MNNRNIFLDEVKGLAVLAVVLFHGGWFKWGWLGVDVFLVIAGYLTASSIARSKKKGTFTFGGFIARRLLRLWPMVLIVSGVALILGLITMLPDDLENLAQSVFASSIFANNILCSISSGNYWAPRNDFLPLLHFWYLGVLMQLYVVHVVLVCLTERCNSRIRLLVFSLLVFVSAILAFLDLLPQSILFYWPVARFWEYGIGVLAYELGMTISSGFMLKIPFIAAIGKASLSIYAWHYVILAFIKYIASPVATTWSIGGFLFALALFAWLSYVYLEQAITTWLGSRRGVAFICVIFVIVGGLALYVVACAGIVRDVPELGLSIANREPGLHNRYNDRIKSFRFRSFDAQGGG